MGRFTVESELRYMPEAAKETGWVENAFNKVRPLLAAAAMWGGQAVTTGPAYADSPLQPSSNTLVLPSSEAADQQVGADFDIRGPNGEAGHFYTQTGNTANLEGFEVLDDKDAKFWTAYQQYGGVSSLGYPISSRFELDGFTVQLTQNALLQWRPEANEAVLGNLADVMHDKGLDDWLVAQGIPPQFTGNDGSHDWEDTKRVRLGWLTDNGIRTAYLANPNPQKITNWDPVVFRGLPVSQPEKMGPFLAQRFQRGAILRWVDQVPGGQPVGTIQFANLGTLAATAGLPPKKDVLVVRLNRFGSGGPTSDNEVVPVVKRDFEPVYTSASGKSEIRNFETGAIGFKPADENSLTLLEDMLKDFGLSGGIKFIPTPGLQRINGTSNLILCKAIQAEALTDARCSSSASPYQKPFISHNTAIDAAGNFIVSYDVTNPTILFKEGDLSMVAISRGLPLRIADLKKLSYDDPLVQKWISVFIAQNPVQTVGPLMV